MPRPKSIRLPEKKPVGSQPICFKRLNQIDPVWCPGPVPRHFWEDEKNHRNYLLWLAHKLRYRRMEHWYRVVYDDVANNKGSHLLTRHHHSIFKMITTLFPEYDWKPWLFTHVSPGFWSRRENRRDYLLWLGEQLGFQKPEDWYHVKASDFLRNHGFTMLKAYPSQGCIISAIMDIYSDYPWEFWLFNKMPNGLFKVRANRLRYLRWLGKRLGYKRPSDWYRVTEKDFRHNYGGGCFPYYQNSPFLAVKDLYPKYPWKEWLFGRVPTGFWNVPENQRRYLVWVGEQLGLRRPEDWYRVTNKDVLRYGGERLLTRYNSNFKMMTALFPEHDWKPWLFVQVSSGFWSRRENRRDYMLWLGEQLGIQKPEDWYRVTVNDFLRNHGAVMLAWYPRGHGYIAPALMDVFPDYPWDYLQFERRSRNFFKERTNRLSYLRWLGDHLGFKQPSDWYRVTEKDFQHNRGGGCLSYYHNSPSRAAMDLYPKYPWMEWLFRRVPKGFWNPPENRRRYMQWLGEQLGFHRPEDWHRVCQQDFCDNHGSQLVSRYRSLRNLLRKLLPDLD